MPITRTPMGQRSAARCLALAAEASSRAHLLGLSLTHTHSEVAEPLPRHNPAWARLYFSGEPIAISSAELLDRLERIEEAEVLAIDWKYTQFGDPSRGFTLCLLALAG